MKIIFLDIYVPDFKNEKENKIIYCINIVLKNHKKNYNIIFLTNKNTKTDMLGI